MLKKINQTENKTTTTREREMLTINVAQSQCTLIEMATYGFISKSRKVLFTKYISKQWQRKKKLEFSVSHSRNEESVVLHSAGPDNKFKFIAIIPESAALRQEKTIYIVEPLEISA